MHSRHHLTDVNELFPVIIHLDTMIPNRGHPQTVPIARVRRNLAEIAFRIATCSLIAEKHATLFRNPGSAPRTSRRLCRFPVALDLVSVSGPRDSPSGRAGNPRVRY